MTVKLNVLSTLAVMGVLQEILPGYADAEVTVRYAPTADLLPMIAGGERADLAILTDSGIDDLAAAGILAAGRIDLVRSYIGVAVKAGTPHPAIADEAAFRAMLLGAASVAYSRAGASGQVFTKLIARLGVAEAVNAKATVIPTGLTGALVADGRAEIAIQQVSELMVVPGIEIIGRLPASLHGGAVFSGGAFVQGQAGAAALLAFLADPALHPVYVRHGLEPVHAVAT